MPQINRLKCLSFEERFVISLIQIFLSENVEILFPVYFCVMEVEQIHMEQTVYAFEGILKFLI